MIQKPFITIIASGRVLLQRRSSLSSACRFPGCPATAVADLIFLVDGSWSVGRPNFKYIRSFISATAGAFQIGKDRTRVGVVQYGDAPRTEFSLNQHLTRPALLKAVSSLLYKGGNTRTGDALSYVLTNGFTEAAGSRRDVPKVLVIITDGRSDDPVESYAKQLRSRGVEIFVLGVHQADEAEMKALASTPFQHHIYRAANFDTIQVVQNDFITQICSSVEDQLSLLTSGEEAVHVNDFYHLPKGQVTFTFHLPRNYFYLPSIMFDKYSS
uniref:VWFA domain-containing protein n=1 Tax=Cyprinodon variegatus TaxID=28743 RepID=A0A3Q2E844_CYPVA